MNVNMLPLNNEILNVTLCLVGVIALIFALVFILNKVKSIKQNHASAIHILNSVSIGAKERILLIEVNEKTLLIGATPTHIETLHLFENDSSQPSLSSEMRHFNKFLSDEVVDFN